MPNKFGRGSKQSNDRLSSAKVTFPNALNKDISLQGISSNTIASPAHISSSVEGKMQGKHSTKEMPLILSPKVVKNLSTQALTHNIEHEEKASVPFLNPTKVTGETSTFNGPTTLPNLDSSPNAFVERNKVEHEISVPSITNTSLIKHSHLNKLADNENYNIVNSIHNLKNTILHSNTSFDGSIHTPSANITNATNINQASSISKNIEMKNTRELGYSPSTPIDYSGAKSANTYSPIKEQSRRESKGHI